MKKSKKLKQFHTASKQIGMGDFYGSGVKNPVGKVLYDSVNNTRVSKNNLAKAPKKLA